MARIVIVDPYSTGHHISYAGALITGLKDAGHVVCAVGNPDWFAPFRDMLSDAIPVTLSKRRVRTVAGEVKKVVFLRRCIAIARSMSPDVIHLLYLDHFVLASALCLGKKNVGIRASLHWGYMLPEFSSTLFSKIKSSVERLLLRWLLRGGLRVIVHSRRLQHRLNDELKFAGADFAPYPVETVHEVSTTSARIFLQNKTGTDSSTRLLLVFGDTRWDKGADIAVRTLPLLPESFHLVIAGRADRLGGEELRSIARSLGVERRLHLLLHHVPEIEVPLYFSGAHIVLIPYRKTFAGQSGPLTIAGTLGVPIVASNIFVLAETVKMYELGTTFEPENPAEMAKAITSIGTVRPSSKELFAADHEKSKFVFYVGLSYFFGASEKSVSVPE